MEKKTKLFLHMGPGFHSLIEKSIFGDKMPSMDFWSQPKETTFLDLVKSTEQAFLNLKQDKVDLYAHCFGAHLALALANKHPDKIGKIVILNSSVHPFNYFVNIGIKLRAFDQIEAMALKSSPAAVQMETIFKLAGLEEFNSMYWFSKEKQQELETKCFSQQPALDLNVFANVFGDFLGQIDKLWNEQLPWKGSVDVIYSKDDILLKYAEDVAPWVQAFPNVKFTSVQGVGHYAHLESPAVADIFFGI